MAALQQQFGRFRSLQIILRVDDAGIDRVLLEAPDRPRDDALRILDRNAPLTKQ